MSTLLTKNQIPFWKMHGAGNDFVVLNALAAPLPGGFDFARAAEEMCAPHFGVGGDGLLLLDQPSVPGAQARMRMWNPDGSEDMCGNGLRCIARLAHDNGHVLERDFVVQTHAGLRQCSMLEAGQVRIEMGEPQFGFAQIPLQPVVNRSETMEYALPVAGRVFPHTVSLSTGSTHTVIFLDEELSEDEFQTLSPQIENHELFPERTTIMWARVLGESSLAVRIWERGAGETLACGTGACATAVAAKITGRATGTIAVQSKGGTLKIEWDGNPIFMTGPTAFVFKGSMEL